MNKIFFHIFTFFFITVLFLSCSKDTSNKVKLSGWVASPVEEKLLQQIIKEFEKKYPDIKVEYEPIPGNYMDKIQLMLATKTAPDVFYLESFYAPALISYNVLEPLDDYIERDTIHLDDFEPALVKAFQSNGNTYGLVKDYTTVGLFYNTDLFRNSSITNPPLNWEELQQFSKKLTKDTNGDGKNDQWGFCVQASLEDVLPFVYQNGGSFFNASKTKLAIKEPEFLDALNYYYNLYKNGYAVLPSDVGSAWPGDAFGKGQIGMMQSGNFAIPFLANNYPNLKYKIAQLPAHKRKATLAYTVGYVIPAHCKNKENAWKLLNYLTGVEGMAKWTSLGLALPPRKSVVIINKLNQDTLKQALITSATFAMPWQLSEHYRLFDESQSALQKIFLSNVKPEKVIDELHESLDKMIFRQRKN